VAHGWVWRVTGVRGRPASSRARGGRGTQGRGRARGCAASRCFDAGTVAVVVAREAHRAVALNKGHAAAAFRPGAPPRVLPRAPLAGKVRDRGAVRPALVDAP